MSSISSVGLASGIDTDAIVEGLIKLQSRPADLLKNRIDVSTNLQGLLQQLSLKLASSRLSASKLTGTQSFAKRTATSSSDTVAASAGPKTAVGTYVVTPRRLVSTSQLLSSGYSSDTASVNTSGAATKVTVSLGGFVDTAADLAYLNGGAGVGVGSIRITDQAGRQATVDLGGATNAEDVVAAINDASTTVQASLDGKRIKLTDVSGGAGALTVTDVSGGTVAKDLGLATLTQSGSTYTGAETFKLGDDLVLGALNNGNGVRKAAGLDDLRISVGGADHDIDLDSAATIGDVIKAISTATGGAVTASAGTDGRLQLTSAQNITVSSINNSFAARDLGIEGLSGTGTLTGRDVLGDLDSTLLTTLKGGYRGAGDTDVTAGQLSIAGTGSATIDLSSATTLADVVAGINGATGTTGVTASIKNARNGIDLVRTGGGSITVADVSGNLGAFLGLNGTATGKLASGDLGAQFVNESTKLSTYDFGAAVPKGKIRVFDGNGASGLVDLSQDSDKTVGDVIKQINALGLAVVARINDTGDGIALERTAGTSDIQVQEVDGGTTAKALGFTAVGTSVLDARRKISVDVAAGATLADLVTALGKSGAPVSASLINDGSAAAPFRLNLTGKVSGRAGELLIDAGATNLKLTTAATANDAVALYGTGGASSSAIRLTSSSNSFDGIVPGLSVQIKGVSDSPVSISVGADIDGIVKSVTEFVGTLNDVKTLIADNSKFDATTFERGTLFTDQSARSAKNFVNSFVNGSFGSSSSTVRTLSQVGITLSDDGTVAFDEDAFRSAYAAAPDDVLGLFSTAKTGAADQFQSQVDLFNSTGGSLVNRLDSIQDTLDRQNASLTDIQARLDARQARLKIQFAQMETIVSGLQGQQNALTQLASLATSFKAT